MENNKLIAEFMGFQETSIGWYDADECLHEKDNTFDTLRFDVDWNWLMPVVEKIESIVFDDNNSFNVTIGSTNYCVIQDSNGDTYDSVEGYGETKLLTVYKAVVGFIKWYNNNN
jgi:hypothetical protein